MQIWGLEGERGAAERLLASQCQTLGQAPPAWAPSVSASLLARPQKHVHLQVVRSQCCSICFLHPSIQPQLPVPRWPEVEGSHVQPPALSCPEGKKGRWLLHSPLMFLGIITVETKFREGEGRRDAEKTKLVAERELKGRDSGGY